ncbi:MAG: hypothetical protein ACQETQ_02465 [Spirochaetota bacterium]
MNVCIIHDSQRGNGKQVAEILGKVFEEDEASVTISHVDKLAAAELPRLAPDLLIVGAAIRKFTVSLNVKRWLRDARRALRRDGAGQPIGRGAVFLTHGLPAKTANAWGKRLLRRLSRSGICAEVYPTWIAGRVTSVEGPLAEGVVESVEAHARELLRLVRTGESI